MTRERGQKALSLSLFPAQLPRPSRILSKNLIPSTEAAPPVPASNSEPEPENPYEAGPVKFELPLRVWDVTRMSSLICFFALWSEILCFEVQPVICSWHLHLILVLSPFDCLHENCPGGASCLQPCSLFMLHFLKNPSTIFSQLTCLHGLQSSQCSAFHSRQ